MGAERITGFTGLVPRTLPSLLAKNQAQEAVNCKLTSGGIDPVYGLKEAGYTAKSGPLKSIYRVTAENGSVFWLSWPKRVEVVRGPLAGDLRFYYTGDGEPRKTTTELATYGGGNDYPKQFYALGVPAPQSAIAAAPSGGSGPSETRYYLRTHVTADGEESAPSPVSAAATGNADGTWSLTFSDSTPLNTAPILAVTKTATTVTVETSSLMTYRVGAEVTVASALGMTDLNATWTIIDVPAPGKFTVALTTAQTYTSGGTVSMVAPWQVSGMTQRIYRTNSGHSDTKFQFVDEIASTATSYSDTKSGVELGETLATRDWDLPSGEMRGLISLPDGGMAGFFGNQLCRSVPGYPHAWPEAYRQAMDSDIMTLGAFDRSIAVATKGKPAVVTGSDPEQVSIDRIDEARPCLSEYGGAAMSFGLLYPSTEGLVLLGSGGLQVVTRDLFTKKEWAHYAPETFVAAAAANRYYALYKTTEDSPYKVIIIDRSEPAALTTASITADAVWCDSESGKLYFVIDNKIYEWDANCAAKMTFFWKSKEFIFPSPVTIGAAKVDAAFTMTPEEQAEAQAAYDAQVAANTAFLSAAPIVNGGMNWYALNGQIVHESDIPAVPPIYFESLTFILYVDGKEMATRDLTGSQPFSLPDGYKGERIEIGVGGNVKVRAVTFGETLLDLKRVPT